MFNVQRLMAHVDAYAAVYERVTITNIDNDYTIVGDENRKGDLLFVDLFRDGFTFKYFPHKDILQFICADGMFIKFSNGDYDYIGSVPIEIPRLFAYLYEVVVLGK
ncbi:hypothetical protein V4836_08100 [Kluyvera ascorbata]|uniref:Uncharacterized protein n=1 Tax=Kluyvera ascorbata TaxID=51288 RepID=A0AB35X883_9ENTR